eukprot:74763_1
MLSNVGSVTLFKIIATSVQSLWTAILFFLLFFKIFKREDKVKFSTALSALGNLAGWSIAYALHAIIQISEADSSLTFNPHAIIILHCTFAVSYSIGFLCSYTFIIGLLFGSFKDSAFAISRCSLYSHLILSVILFFGCLTGTFFRYLSQNDLYYFLGNMITFAHILFYILGLSTLVYSLNIRLIKTILANQKTDFEAKFKKNSFTRMQADFLHTVTKLSLLQSIFIVSAILYVTFSVLHHLLFANTVSDIMDWSLYAMLIIIATLCMYLTFGVNLTEYNCICNLCNKCCLRCCYATVSYLYGAQLIHVKTLQIQHASSNTRSMQSTTMRTNSTRSMQYKDPDPHSHLGHLPTISDRKQLDIDLDLTEMDIVYDGDDPVPPPMVPLSKITPQPSFNNDASVPEEAT